MFFARSRRKKNKINVVPLLTYIRCTKEGCGPLRRLGLSPVDTLSDTYQIRRGPVRSLFAVILKSYGDR